MFLRDSFGVNKDTKFDVIYVLISGLLVNGGLALCQYYPYHGGFMLGLILTALGFLAGIAFCVISYINDNNQADKHD